MAEDSLPEERFAAKRVVRRILFWLTLIGLLSGLGMTLRDIVSGSPDEPEAPTSDDYAGGWGPDRPMFTIAEPATFAAFNAISDNPNIGDERNFVGVKLDDSEVGTLWNDRLDVSIGDQIRVRAFYENSAADNFVDGAPAWLQGAAVEFGFTTGSHLEAHVWATLTADNATTVWDGATLESDELFSIESVPRTGLLENNAHPDGGTPIATSELIRGGASLGYNQRDGVIKPGYQYAGYVTFDLLIVPG
jgi:hypothetical protein